MPYQYTIGNHMGYRYPKSSILSNFAYSVRMLKQLHQKIKAVIRPGQVNSQFIENHMRAGGHFSHFIT